MTSSQEEGFGGSVGWVEHLFIQKPVDFDEFRQMVNQIGLFWMVVNQAPPSSAFSAE